MPFLCVYSLRVYLSLIASGIGYDGFVMVYACVHETNIQLSIFVQRFFNDGPGAVGIDMDDGFQLMEQYSHQFKSLEQQRHEFGNEKHIHMRV